MPEIEEQFKISEDISLALIDGKTIILVNNEEFRHCKFLFLVNPQENKIQEEISSIDEAEEFLSGELEKKISPEEIGINSREEFWAHCSNLQAWVENDYDTRILHRNLAFPLLRELTRLKDPKAKKVFKDEIIKRLDSGYKPVIVYLLEEKYITDEIFTREELDTLFNLIDEKIINEVANNDDDLSELLIVIELLKLFSDETLSENLNLITEFMMNSDINKISDSSVENLKEEALSSILDYLSDQDIPDLINKLTPSVIMRFKKLFDIKRF